MKKRDFSHHIWRAIEAQAKTMADNLARCKTTSLCDDDIATTNKFELERLNILIQQLEEESPK
ncbi:hypothetical protein A6E02_11360 [Aliivibrio fischeri]|nr:hypothetical protein [Aliivibrio fischeri]OCH43688.1 hypothetical protein A6E02_11360 [Aliivibrio fischeri]OED52869.1 hypothetical protein BEI47_18605 [Aliivibrio fischeri]